MKLTRPPKLFYNKDEWTEWLIKNVNKINKNIFLTEDKRKDLYYQIFLTICKCGYETALKLNEK